MSNSVTETISPDLANLAQRTGLIIRPVDADTIESVFAQIEKYDATERAETFADLKKGLNETRTSVGAEPAFSE